MPSIRSIWSCHHQERHSWAHAANEAFHASLSSDVRQRLLHKDAREEAYIVVFGSTQVGKTTLLLDLMGVSDESASRVSEVLRGGRAGGRSSTPTAMEYRRSCDEIWVLKGSGEPEYFTSDDDVSTALGELRSQMECGRLRHDRPFEVSIPVECFNPRADQPLVRMLDLPGEGAQGQAEQRHVEDMARRYVALADLILLVGKSDRLDFLRADALALPGVEDWQLVPSRFRIITTHSFTLQTIRDQVREHDGPLDAAFFRQRLIEQIGIAVPLLEHSRRPERFFPLEFGRSWQGLQESDPGFHETASRITAGLKQKLLSDIKAATTPLARIKSAVLAHEVVSRIKVARFQEAEAQLSALKGVESGLIADLNALEEVSDSAQRAAEALRNQLSHLAPPLIDGDLSDYVVAGVVSNPTRSVMSMREEMAKARGGLLRSAQEDRPAVGSTGQANASDSDVADEVDAIRRHFWRRLQPPAVGAADRKIIDTHFSELGKKLDIYVLDSYLPDKYVPTWLNENFDKDKRALHQAFFAAQTALSRHRRTQWKSRADASIKSLEVKLSHQAGLRSSSLLTIEHLRAKLKDIHAQQHTLESEHEAQHEQLERDLQESKRFKQTLDEAYLAKLRHLRAEVHGEPGASRKLMSLFAALHMSHAREELSRVTEDTH